MGYRHGAHSVFEIHLHLVWATKYRKPILAGEVGLRVRELIRQCCREEEVDILKGHVAKDHVHLFVSIPPQVTISRLVQRLKGRTRQGQGTGPGDVVAIIAFLLTSRSACGGGR